MVLFIYLFHYYQNSTALFRGKMILSKKLLLVCIFTFCSCLFAYPTNSITNSSVRIIEGNAESDGGHKYRLHIFAKATDKKPQRLIVWLHGRAKESGNKYVKPMAKDFIKKGFALMVFEKDSYLKWNQKKLLKTLDAVKNIPGLSTEKPIMLCYSLGGQTAIKMWWKDPGQFGGLILNSAYPLNYKAYYKDKISKLGKIPKQNSVKEVPILAIVGTEDEGKIVWEEAEKEYPKHGIDITVHYVPGKGHKFMLNETNVFKKVLNWLDKLGGKTKYK